MKVWLAVLAALGSLAGTVTPRPDPRAVPIPAFDPASFRTPADNPYFPLRPGTLLVYRDRAGIEVDSMLVTRETRDILGVRAVVVRDRAYRGGALVEATIDWYAWDHEGNVWYLGEDTKEYKNGRVVSTAGSWEAGRGGARAGILVPARPKIGAAYRQEYRAGVAEDMARALRLDAKVVVPYGTFDLCLETEDWSPLEPGVLERKFYARGVGCVLEETVRGGRARMELVRVISP